MYDCASGTLQLWSWNFLETLMQPGPPDTMGMVTEFYTLSIVYTEENIKPSFTNDFKELNWAIWDSIRGLDTKS